MVERIENAVPPMILEYIRTQVQNEERWSFTYPKGAAFEKNTLNLLYMTVVRFQMRSSLKASHIWFC